MARVYRLSRAVLLAIVMTVFSATALAQTPPTTNPNADSQTQARQNVAAAPTASVGQQKKPNAKNRDNFLDEMDAALKKELGDTKANGPVEKKTRKKSSWLWQITKTTLALGFMLAIFYFAYKLFLFKRALPAQVSTVIRSLYNYPIEPGKNLRLVELNDKLLLLGVSDAGIQLVTTIDNKDEIEQIKLDCQRDNSQGKPDFLGELTGAIKNRFGKKEFQEQFTEDDSEWASIRKSTKDKLQSLRDSKDSLRQLDDNSWKNQ